MGRSEVASLGLTLYHDSIYGDMLRGRMGFISSVSFIRSRINNKRIKGLTVIGLFRRGFGVIGAQKED